MRRSDLLLISLGTQVLLFLLLLVHASVREEKAAAVLSLKSRVVEELALTDLCLFTEASYTRHLTQADMNTPFQEHPLSLEHFPSGSLVAPPSGLKRMNVQLD